MRFITTSLPKAEEWACLPPADDCSQTIITACRQRMKREYWRNTQFLCLNQLGLNPQVLTPTPSYCGQLSIPPWDKPHPIPTVITPVDKRMSPSQQRDLSLQTLTSIPKRTFRSSQMVPLKMKSMTAVPVWKTSAKMTSSTSGMHPRAPIVAPSRQRRLPSKKLSNGYPPLHHEHQLSSSATANHWSKPSTMLTQLTHLSTNCRL